VGTPHRNYNDVSAHVSRDRKLRISKMQGAGTKTQAATRRTARCQQELRSDNVGGSAEAALAAAGRLGHGVVACRLAQLATGRTWSRDEESVLNEGYARLGMCRVCIIRRPRAHTCMYVYTMDGAISTHIDTHEHMQSLTCTCIYTCTHILHVDLLVIYAQ